MFLPSATGSTQLVRCSALLALLLTLSFGRMAKNGPADLVRQQAITQMVRDLADTETRGEFDALWEEKKRWLKEDGVAPKAFLSYFRGTYVEFSHGDVAGRRPWFPDRWARFGNPGTDRVNRLEPVNRLLKELADTVRLIFFFLSSFNFLAAF